MPLTVHAFFDFDGTLVEGDSISYWLRYYYRKRPARRIFQLANGLGLLAYLFRLVDSHTLKRIFLWPMSFESAATLEDLTAHFVHGDLVFRFHRPVLERLWTHHYLGHKVVVISASGMFYLKHIQGVLPPCVLLGTEIEFGTGFFRFPKYHGGNLRGENKLRRLRELGMGEAGNSGWGYSDHEHDFPLLEFVKHPVCVQPTRALRRKAKALGWTVWELPESRPAWRKNLESLLLLVFAWAPESFVDRSQGAQLPGRPRQDAPPPFVREHTRVIREGTR